MRFFATFEVMYRVQEIFWFFSQLSSFSSTLSLQNEILNSHERFFFTMIRPYQVLRFIRTTSWAFTLTLWCIPFCIRKFILKICACGYRWSVSKNSKSENSHSIKKRKNYISYHPPWGRRPLSMERQQETATKPCVSLPIKYLNLKLKVKCNGYYDSMIRYIQKQCSTANFLEISRFCETINNGEFS